VAVVRSERMELRVDRDAEALRGARVHAAPALVFPLDTTIVTLRVATTGTRLDRSSFAIVPARIAHTIDAPPAGTIAVVTLGVTDALRATTVRDYP